MVFNIGGAYKLGAANDATFFNNLVAGSIVYIKKGTYTGAASLTTTAAGTGQSPIRVYGYDTTRGDAPADFILSRPVLNWGAGTISTGVNFEIYYLNIKGNPTTSFVSVGSSCKLVGCKVNNYTTTANVPAISMTATNSFVEDCEAVSPFGIGIQTPNNSSNTCITDSYVHDCVTCLNLRASSTPTILVQGCLITAGTTACITIGGNTTGSVFILNNTLYGANNKLGLGINIVTGAANIRIRGNHIGGFTTGITHADTQTVGYDDWNNFYNNTNDVSAAGQWHKGPHDTAVDPQFASVGQLTGATATTSSNTLTQTGAFSGITDGADYIYVSAGTGVTAGRYPISSHTADTVTSADIAFGTDATADKVWQITTGHDFAVGVNMKGIGGPAKLPGGLTANYRDSGVAQRQESVTGITSYAFGN